MNKADKTVQHLLDVTCEQTYLHVLLRGIVSFCADASTACLIRGMDPAISSTLALMNVTGRDAVASAADFIVISGVISDASQLAACLSDVEGSADAAPFVFLCVAEKFDRATLSGALHGKQLNLLRYRIVQGGFAAVWLGPPKESRREPQNAMIGSKVMVLSDRPNSTLTRIRLGVPLQFLADELDIDLIFRSFADFNFSDLRKADFFIAQRGAHRRAHSILSIIKKFGSFYVYEIDDLLTEIPEFLAHHSGLIENKSIISDLVSKAALVTCTQEKLRQKMLHLNPQVSVCGNYGDPYLLPRHQARQAAMNNAIVTIMIAASDRILVHFLMEALKRLLIVHQGQVKLVVVGPIGDEFRKNNIEARYIEIIPHLEFTAFAAGLKNPVGVIPLDDSEFSSCKSAVKYFDYSVAGLATVCSKVSPYREVIDHGVNGLLVENTTDAWFEALNSLVVNGALRATLAMRAAQCTRALHGLDIVISQWYDVIDAMLAKVKVAARPISGFEKIKFKWMCFSLALRSINHQRIEMRRAAKANSSLLT